jgi:hypothetical protein
MARWRSVDRLDHISSIMLKLWSRRDLRRPYLKGVAATERPVEQPTEFELVISLKTAKALNIKIPQAVLLRDDEAIQRCADVRLLADRVQSVASMCAPGTMDRLSRVWLRRGPSIRAICRRFVRARRLSGGHYPATFKESRSCVSVLVTQLLRLHLRYWRWSSCLPWRCVGTLSGVDKANGKLATLDP